MVAPNFCLVCPHADEAIKQAYAYALRQFAWESQYHPVVVSDSEDGEEDQPVRKKARLMVRRWLSAWDA